MLCLVVGNLLKIGNYHIGLAVILIFGMETVVAHTKNIGGFSGFHAIGGIFNN